MSGFRVPDAPGRPTMFFVGVSTGGSFINRLFPVWAECLDLGAVGFQGIDLPPDVGADDVVAAVRFLADCETVRGALVTTHKIAVFEHARALFASLDPYAMQLGEISCITKAPQGLAGSAKDPITGGLALDLLVGPDHWDRHPDGAALLMGSGGASVALAASLLAHVSESWPAHILLTDVDPGRLALAKRHLSALDLMRLVETQRVAGAADHDRLIAELGAGSLVVNGTGMGKDRPGSPVSEAVVFPEDGIVWELNYRGALGFLEQAAQQAQTRRLTVADGWRYFLFGWAYAIADVFGIDMTPALMDRLEAAAEQVRGDVR